MPKKPGPLDAFLDTYSGSSTTSGTMSDRFSSLPGSSTRKAPQKKERPAPAQERKDPVLALLAALYSSATGTLTVVELMKKADIGPSEAFDLTTKAKELGLLAETVGAGGKSYKLTEDGIAYVKDMPA